MSKLLPILISVFSLSACGQTANTYKSPAGYDFGKPQRSKLEPALKEISGICFRPGNNEYLYAIQDEDGKVFRWPAAHTKELTHLRFAGNGDYEDLAITNNYVVVLRSDGVLFTFPVAAPSDMSLPQVQEWKNLLPEGEYEALSATADGNLYVLCKNCAPDKNKARSSGYILRLDGQGKPGLQKEFSISGLQDLVPGKKANLKASAMALHPKTRQWYILSSVNKLLLLTDQSWKPLKAIALDPDLFPQPEGICFDTAGNLYISNEAANNPAATLLKFPYLQPH